MLQGKRKSSKQIGERDKRVERYGATGFMYTEYPHKKFWDKSLGDIQYKSALASELGSSKENPLMLYVHLPFCQELCWFCTCHVSITNQYGKIIDYLKLLFKEIDLLSKAFQENAIKPKFVEIL